MKVIIVLISLVMTLSVHADMQYKIEDGKLLSAPSSWSDTGVKVTPEAKKYPNAVIAALRQPSVPVEAEKRDVFSDRKMTGLFHQQRSKTITRVSVVYHHEGGGVISVVEDTFKELMEAGFNPYLISWLISIGLMVVTVKLKAGPIALLAAVISAAVAMCVTTHIAMIVTAFAVIAAILTSACISEKPSEQYIFFSRAFYFLMSVSAVITYYPLFT